MKPKLLPLLFLLSFFSNIYASLPAVGEWRVHPSFHEFTQVVDGGDVVYAVADGHLLSITKEEKFMETFSKSNGLSDNLVDCIAYDSSSKKLIVAYVNSNIDVIDSDGVIHNIRDLFSKDIKADKDVKSIMIYDRCAYLCTGLGIVVVNLDKYEVKDTYIIGDNGGIVPVYSMVSDGVSFYALMGKSIKMAPVKGVNLLDYNSWKPLGIPLPSTDIVYTTLGHHSGCMVIAGESGGVYRYVDEGWSLIYDNPTNDAVWAHVSSGNLLCGRSDCQMCLINSNWEIQTYNVCNADAIYIPSGQFWVASKDEGLKNIIPNEGGTTSTYRPNGPYLSQSQRINSSGNITLTAPGHSRLNRGMRPGAVMVYEDGNWSSYTRDNSGAAAITPDGFFYDVVSVISDPSDPNHIYATTWGEGVYEFLNGKAVALYNTESTGGVLKSTLGLGNHFVRADGLAFDKDGNLWVATSLQESLGSYNPICYMTPDKVWHEAEGFSPLETAMLLQQIHFHSSGTMFVLSARSPAGIFVKNGSNKRFFTSFTDKDGKTMTPSEIYDIVEDKNGTVWIGTDVGPILFNNVNKIFETAYRCTRIKIPREDGTGLADYLLDGIPVKAIDVDGGNRKWIGTTNGLYIVSDDGLTTYSHFTEDNSPMPSNDVTSISVNGNTGSVLIGTGNSIVEYRDGVTEPVKKFDDDKIKVFPNPVTPDFTGFITVTGLEENTVVKITDASGRLVHEGKSNGGSFSWDGKYRGSYVSGGVYFFHLFNTNENNSRSSAAKVLIIR